MKFTKPALTLAQQVDLLVERGMTVADRHRLERILGSISYYRLSAYWYTYYQGSASDHRFKSGTDFEEVYATYKFDRDLRALLFEQMERLEIALRAQVIYHYSLAYGANWYEQKELFRKPSYCFKFNELLQKEMDRASEVYIRHYRSKYTEPENPPAWMTLELASFGQLSLLYKNLNTCDAKKRVAAHFGVHHSVLTSWLGTLSFVRNSCAHHSRLWNRKLPNPTQWPDKLTGWPAQQPLADKYNRIYPALCALAFLLRQLATHDHFAQRLIALIDKYPTIPLDYMGFHPQWKHEALWQHKPKP